jgi:hypothetical protein
VAAKTCVLIYRFEFIEKFFAAADLTTLDLIKTYFTLFIKKYPLAPLLNPLQ